MNPSSVVLIGMESVGKSAIFRRLTGYQSGDETNFRGSTVVCRHARLQGSSCDCEVVDTPGIRLASDSLTTALALEKADKASTLLFIARATHALEEIPALLASVTLKNRPAALILTFEDKVADLSESLSQISSSLKIPVAAVNGRDIGPENFKKILHAIETASPVSSSFKERPLSATMETIHPETTVFEHPRFGAWFGLLSCLAMFVLPVYAAYKASGWLQSAVDALFMNPMKSWSASWPALLKVALMGDYGIVSLGGYSFVWAFPVVVCMGLSVALAEETGLKDRITAALDPWLRRIGLSGRDLIPVLSVFGCNVAAVFQSRSCCACTRKSCVSLISFASACSYQIGASLSIFGSSGRPWLFLPYLAALFFVGAAHTRFWNGSLSGERASALSERAFLQPPSWRALAWRLKTAVRQFLFQAMPVFLLLCGASALLQHFGVLNLIFEAAGPFVRIFGLPETVAPALGLSILRKDGLLVLNQGAGATLANLSASQIFLTVYLASTLTACLVTLYTVGRELGFRSAAQIAGKQVMTSAVSAFVFSLILAF